MAADERAGTLYWIDHYVVPVTDLDRWSAFYTNVLGAKPEAVGDEPGSAQANRQMLFTFGARGCHVGGSVSREPLEPSAGLGVGLPRYSWYVRTEDLGEHLRRLDQWGVPHTDPIRTDEDGEEGTAIRFEDPDYNQLEFWAPRQMPTGAMDGETPCRVGRIRGAVFQSRDLARTQAFFEEFCGLQASQGGDLPGDTVLFTLGCGGRLTFKRANVLSKRSGGNVVYRALHTALIVKDDAFMPMMEHMWEKLPEWDFVPGASPRLPLEEAQSLPARVGLHGNPIGPEWKKLFGRGDSFYDWDTNTFHFVAASPGDGSMVNPKGVSQRRYMEQYQAAV